MQSTKVYALLLSLPFRQRHERGATEPYLYVLCCMLCTKFEAYAVQLVLGNRKDESVTGSTTGATEVAGVPAGGVDGDIGRSGSGD
jgi:hypothetical protein